MKFSLLSTLIGLGCSSDKAVTVYNTNPEATIVSHSDGEEFLQGYETVWQGTVSDANHDMNELTVTWSSDQRTLCPESQPEADGTTICSASLEADESSIRLQVTDPEGASGLASIEVTVLETSPPSVSIISPTSDGLYYSDQLILLSATITDEEDDPSDLSYQWTSSVDGVLATTAQPDSSGLMEEYVNLSEGEHALTLNVEDLSGKSASDSINVLVGGPNTNPNCAITSPETNASFIAGETIVFSANANDEELAMDGLSIAWTSDKDGDLGSGVINSSGDVTLATADLSTNTHTIQFTVEDEIGSSCSDSIIISIGTPPTLTLTAPENDDIFALGNSVSFQGTLVDNEEVASNISLSWFSDVDGEFSTQSANSNGTITLNTSSLSAGIHNITITATDGIGLTDSATLSIRINTLPTAPNVTISPDPANTGDTLLAYASGSTDGDGQNVAYSYEWYQNGIVTSNITASIDSSQTAKGELWAVRVTPNDGYQDGNYTEAIITIENAEPSIDTVSITPSLPNTTDTLLCNVGVIEEDGDTLIESYTWTNTTTGATLGSNSSLELSSDIVSPGDSVSCSYTVSDGDASDSISSSVYISNSGPTVNSVTISPSESTIGDTLTCSLDANDPDQLGYTESFTWTNSTTGGTLGAAATLTLTAQMASPTDEITCSATAVDPSGATGSGSDSIILLNQDPEIDSITFSPTSPAIGDTVECVATTSDGDEEDLTLIYEWFNEESGISIGSDAELEIDSSIAVGGDEISCTVTAVDGYGSSVSASESFVLGNTAPTIDSISVSDNNPKSSDTITCSAVVTDLDGDSITETYTWYNESTATTLGSGASITLSPLSVQPGSTIRCTLLAEDGSSSDTGSVYVTIANTEPVINSLNISPSTPYLGDTLNCIGDSEDADLESLSEDYVWNNITTGDLIGSSSSITLGSALAAPNDEISCSLTITDPSGDTATDSTTAIVSNLPPAITSLSIDAASVAIGDSIECSATATDPEGDIPTYSYEWSNSTSTSIIGTGPTLTLTSSMATGGDEITCTATATDSYAGTDSESTSIYVESTVPDFTTAANIIPGTGITTSTSLSCSGVAIDPDGGSVSMTYEWTNTSQSSVIGSNTSLTLSPSIAQPTDVITCTITAEDTTGEQAISSASVAVINTAPSLSDIEISPSSAIDTSSTLTCSATLTDDDDEGLSISYEWTNGTTTLGSTNTLTLTPTTAAPGDTITCTASVTDNYGASDTLTSSVSIANTAPVISDVSISPDPAYNDDTLTCSITASDADGQSLSESFTWTNTTTGATLGTGSTLTLDSTLASRNDVVSCAAGVVDGSGDSDSDSTTITIGNRAPNSPTLELSPDPAYISSTLTCAVSAGSDPDDDTLTYTYAWSINGTDHTETSSSLSGVFVAEDVIACTVTPSDGLLEGTAASVSITISNQAPTVDSVSLSPDPLYTTETLTASATASDLDGNTLLLDYTWSVNGTEVQSGTGTTLDSSLFNKEDTVEVSVTADDSFDTSTPVTASLTVSNTPPEAPSISISPTSPTEQEDNLVCSVDTDSTDDDSDTVSYTFTWTVDGVDFGDATDFASSSTVAAIETNSSEEWECTVVPNDGDEDGTAISTSVVIESAWDGAITFTNCAQTGNTGPSQSQCDSEYSGSNLQDLVTLSSGIQSYTIPSDGSYTIEVYGAEGGKGTDSDGTGTPGQGAQIIGTFTLSEDDVLNIIVGQQGLAAGGGGGGGGTFVWISGSSTPLIVAGGGGGAGDFSQSSYYDARGGVTSESGTSSRSGSGSAGTSGNGGGSGGSGGGGGGWSGSGSGSYGGTAALSGGNGGANGGASGGFGGGGANGASGSTDSEGAGGGGGYSGGGGGDSGNDDGGGGGGSYNDGSNQSGTSGYNSGHGYVIIDKN